MITIKQTLLISFVLIYSSLLAQDKFTLNGTITDVKSNETLIGVNIIFPELQTGTNTNEYGFYSISLEEGTYKVQISYLGYNSVIQTIAFSEDQTINFKLEESTENLNEVIIKQDVEQLNIKKPQMSVNKMFS